MSKKNLHKHSLRNPFVNVFGLASGVPGRDLFSDPGFKIAL